MYVIFLIWECPDIQEITIHAFHKIYLNIKMSDFDLKMKYFCGVLSIYIYIYIYIYIEGYSESTEPIDAVNYLPLARFEPTTSTTPPSTTPDIDATNCATETSPKKDVQEALILTTPDAVHVVYWFLFNAWHLFRSQVKA